MADLRKCIGSAKFGIEPHEAPVTEFPVQASQKDGLGRMCKPHWTAYTRALRHSANDGTAKKATREAAVHTKAAAKSGWRESRRTQAEKRAAAITPAPKPKAKRTRTGDASPEATAEHNATVREEARASTPDFDALAAADPILAERKQRVKAWRKSEVQGTPMVAPGAGSDAMEA